MSLLKQLFGGKQKKMIEKEYSINDMGRTTRIKYIEDLIEHINGQTITYDKFLELLSSDWFGGTPRKFHRVTHCYIEYLDPGSSKYFEYYRKQIVKKPYGDAIIHENLENHFIRAYDGRITLVKKYTRKRESSAFEEVETEIEDYGEIEKLSKREVKKVSLDNKKLSVVFERSSPYKRIGVLIFELV